VLLVGDTGIVLTYATKCVAWSEKTDFNLPQASRRFKGLLRFTLDASDTKCRKCEETHENTSTPPMTSFSTSIWSDALQHETREAILEWTLAPIAPLHFKHPDCGFAYASPVEQSHGYLTLHCKQSGHVYQFDDANALLQAGWAID
jgi:hypothetical protein